MKNEQTIRDKQFMSVALEQARIGRTPYGCVISDGRQVMVSAYNTVIKDKDPTAHAEINAIRLLSKEPTYGEKNLTLYSTAEPCPMCMSAIIYAGIHRVVFGVNIVEISRFQDQIRISSGDVVSAGFEQIEIIAGVMYEECLNLFKTKDHDQR
ncbi:MAG: nucleoside deaminase [Bacteroidales bacterium]